MPLTHHKLLLSVRNQDAKVQLAQKAVAQELSSREFGKVVAQVRIANAETPRGGRPRLPAFVKGLTRLRQAIDVATSESINRETFATYKPAKARSLAEELDSHIATLTKIKENILTVVDEIERAP